MLSRERGLPQMFRLMLLALLTMLVACANHVSVEKSEGTGDGNCWTGLCIRAEICATP